MQPLPPSDGYWDGRRADLLEQIESDEAELARKLDGLYRKEAARLKQEIAAYYARYGKGNVIEYRELLKTLSIEDSRLLIERMDDFAKKYPQYAHLMPVMESVYKLNELGGLHRSFLLHQYEIGAAEVESVQSHLDRVSSLGASLAVEQAGIAPGFYVAAAHVAASTVGAAWAKGHAFSDRIWANKERLAAYLNDDFSRALARGAKYDDVARELVERFEGVSRKDAARLVFTEGTFVFNESNARVLSEHFDAYRIATAQDAKVCKVCRAVASEQSSRPVAFADRVPGVNFPPLHPWCRCTVIPMVDDWDAWIERYVAEHRKTVDYSGLSGKQMRRLTRNEVRGFEKLATCGLSVVVLPTISGRPANIDMMLNGELWELKTPVGNGSSIHKRLREGVTKWRRLRTAGLISGGQTPRIVVDNRLCSMPDDEMEEMIRSSMTFFAADGFDEAMLIAKSGDVRIVNAQK